MTKSKILGFQIFIDMADNNHLKSKIFYISLHQKYTFGLVVHKTKSNQKWPKVKYSGSKPFLDMADNNHIKLNIFYISLNQKYTFGLVVHKTKSNQEWPKVNYSGLKPYIDMDDNNHKKLNIFNISLHRKYTFGLVVHKTKSNQKWLKVKSARKRQYVKKKETLSVSANIPLPPSLPFLFCKTILYDYYQQYQEMVLNLNISLLVTFGYFSSCGRQDQKYTFGGGICR